MHTFFLLIATIPKVTKFASFIIHDFFLGDVNFFKQYHRAMAPMCCALDVIQGEEKAYMGLLLPTLAITLKRLKILKSDGSLTICSSLIEKLQKSLNQRFILKIWTASLQLQFILILNWRG